MNTHQTITIADLEHEVVPTNFNSVMWQPIVLLGSPGTAKTMWLKTRLVQMYADHLGVDFSDIGLVVEKPARRDAAELAGVSLPSTDEDGTVCTKFTRSPVLGKILATGKKYGILLWDELAAARPPEQIVAADSIDPEEHEVGGEPIPRGWIVTATGNRAQDKSNAIRLLSHLTNRALVFNMQFDINAWTKWAHDNSINPVVIECAEAYNDAGFFADAVPTEDIAFCTPRSLVRAAAHLDAYMASDRFDGVISPTMEKMLAANIGPAAANTLTQWIGQRDHVPTAEDILRDPENAMVPDQTGFQMIAANVAMGAVSDARSATAVLHYICRLRPDLQVSLGTKLMAITVRERMTITDPLAAAFIEKFHELLPLAVNGQ